jgi:DNA-binding IclR family transcriptional regulator
MTKGDRRQLTDRLVDLLAALASEQRPLSALELSERVRLPLSTVYRLTGELEGHGLVTRRPRDGFTLGLRLLGFARSIQDNVEEWLVRPAEDTMRSLSRTYGETAILTAPAGGFAIGLAAVASPTPGVHLTFGRWDMRPMQPMHLGASGKVLLAFLDEAAAEEILSAATDSVFASGTPVNVRALREQLVEIRRDGYVITHAELDLGATAVAAPIRDPRGHPIAALTLAGLSVRMQPKLDEAVPAVVTGAQAIADRMGSDSPR